MNHDSGYVKIKVHDIIDRKHILHELITWGLWLKVRLPGRRRRGWSERMLSMGKKKLDWFYLMSSLIPIKVAMRCLRPAPFKLKTPPIACWTKWTSNQQVLRGMEPSMNRLQKKFLLDLGLSGFLFIVGVSSHNKKKKHTHRNRPCSLEVEFPCGVWDDLDVLHLASVRHNPWEEDWLGRTSQGLDWVIYVEKWCWYLNTFIDMYSWWFQSICRKSLLAMMMREAKGYLAAW